MTQTLSFPLTGPDANQQYHWASEEQSIREVIWHILLTEPGERLMRPEFGAGLNRYIHYPNNETTRRLIADVALAALKRWEPRIDILELTVTSAPTEQTDVTLALVYRQRATGLQDSVQLGLQLGL